MNLHKNRGLLVLLASVLALPLAALGMDLDQKVRFDIPAQELSSALIQFSKQARLQVVLSDEVAGQSTQGISGQHSIKQALSLLLEPAGLRYRVAGETTISISRFDTTANVPVKDIEGMTLARNAGAASAREVDNTEVAQEDADKSQSDKAQEIVVTGSHIRGTHPAGTNLITIDRSALAERGVATVQDVLRTLPQNFTGGQTETTSIAGATGLSTGSYGSSVNLRALGADATLALVNGRRLAPAGSAGFADISSIPLSMIERVEIIPDGASATYGSDAVGGVVNFILRRNFSGAETQARYGRLTDGGTPELQLSQMLGHAWATGGVLLGYEFYERDSLAASSRAFTANDDLTALGGSNFSSTQSNPGNITRIGTTNVTLAVPSGQNGTVLPQSTLLSGQVNYQNGQEFSDLLPLQKRQSVMLSAYQSLNEAVDLFAQVLASDRDAIFTDVQPGLTLTIPETNAYRRLNNLFAGLGNLTMSYNPTDDLGPSRSITDSRAGTGTFGAHVKLAGSWLAEMSGTYSRLKEHSFNGTTVDSSVLRTALASDNVLTAFNPFADGSNTPPSVLAGIIGSRLSTSETMIRTATARADGAIFDMAGGVAKLAIGAEYRDEDFVSFTDSVSPAGVLTRSNPLPPGKRNVKAAFAEAYLPVISQANARPGIRRLEVSASGRYESYDDVGDTTNPRIGLRWSPFELISVQGSYGTSFKAPLFSYSNRPTTGGVSILPTTIDPQATGGNTVTLFRIGSNPNLKPEKARSWTAGLRFGPESGGKFSATATYSDVLFKDRVVSPDGYDRIFGNPANYGDALIRSPTQAQVDAILASADTFIGIPPAPGTIEAFVDFSFTNRAQVHVSSIDLNTDYRLDHGSGTYRFRFDASYLTRYDEQFAVTSPVVRNLNTIRRPVDLRLRTGLSWTQRALGASLFANYVDNYRDNLSIPSREIASWTTLDLQLRYDGRGARSTLLNKMSLSLSANNVLDKDPPFVNSITGFGFDPANANPQGRQVAVDVVFSW